MQPRCNLPRPARQALPFTSKRLQRCCRLTVAARQCWLFFELVAQHGQIVLASERFDELLVGAVARGSRVGPSIFEEGRRVEAILLALAPFVTLFFRRAMVMTLAPSLACAARHALGAQRHSRRARFPGSRRIQRGSGADPAIVA